MTLTDIPHPVSTVTIVQPTKADDLEADYRSLGQLSSLTVPVDIPRSIVSNRRERFIRFVKRNFISLIYLTIALQLGANIAVLTALPAILIKDVLYARIPLTRPVVSSQVITMLGSCVINHLLIAEWYFVYSRYHLAEGDVLGVAGILLLFVTALSIDACRLILSHLHLFELRRADGTNASIYTRECFETYLSLAQDIVQETVVLTPRQNLIELYQCCGNPKSVVDSLNLFVMLPPNITITNLTAHGLRCCKTNCMCTAQASEYTMCLSDLMNEMSDVYSSTYPVYIVFVVTSVCSILAFLYYNSQVGDDDR